MESLARWRATSALLATALVATSTTVAVLVARAREDALADTRRSVAAEVHDLLCRGEPAKAALAISAFPDDPASRLAADLARLDVALASDLDAAASLLDLVRTTGRSPDFVERAVAARLAVSRRLFLERVLRDGAVPAPFDLEAFEHERGPGLDARALSKITASLLSSLDAARDVSRQRGRSLDPSDERLASLAQVVRYALGEVAFEDLRPGDDEVRVQLGLLLLKERQIDRAVETWKPVSKDPRVQRKLAELAALRRHAPAGLHVWDYELEPLVVDSKVALEEETRVAALLSRARRWPHREAPRTVVEEPKVFFPGAGEHDATEEVHAIERAALEPTADPDELWLLDRHEAFRLEPLGDRPSTTRAPAAFSLHSAYRGPIRARLYRVPDLQTFRALTEETLLARRGSLALEKEWETTFAPLSRNDRSVDRWKLECPRTGEGFFLLVADARYSPVHAVAKLVVTDSALVLDVALDEVLVYAAQRGSGAPTAGLELAGEVFGRYVLGKEELLAPEGAVSDEFRRGFETSWSGQEAEPEPSRSYALGFARAREVRARFPEVRWTFRGKTDASGLLEVPVSPAWVAGYRYEVTASCERSATRVSSEYSPDGTRTLRALVYTDRPLYRPGDLVSWKAILRIVDGEGLAPYDGKDALIEIGGARGTVFTRSVRVSDLGTASGSFELPASSPGDTVPDRSYWVSVNGGRHAAIFDVEEYRKPEVEIVLDHPRSLAAGDVLPVRGLVRTLSGDPVPSCDVWLRLSVPPRAASVASGSDERAESWRWEPVLSRNLKTDDAGRFEARLETDSQAGSCSLTVGTVDPSGRVTTRSSSFETTGAAPEVEIETDRPRYKAGEVARIRLHAPRANVVRVEEKMLEAKEGAERPGRHVLVLVATGKIHERRLVSVAGTEATVEVPVGPDLSPNAGVVAFSVDSDRIDTAQAQLVVPPRDRFLTVSVETDRSEYRPGDECTALLSVVDARGAPVAGCELSLGVVDEAIFQLRGDATPDLREFFHRYERRVSLAQAFFSREETGAFTIWKLPVLVRGLPSLCTLVSSGSGGGGGRYGGRYGGRRNLVARGGGCAATASGRARSDFKETALFEASIVTDASGKATVRFPFPDNLTSFRFTARGITRDHKVGSVVQHALVRK
ncbi:hypothetical protein HY251_07210, partial [bacterium]|nr:hypothetical protein [bacterium]